MKNSDRRRRDEEPKKRGDGPENLAEERVTRLQAANQRLQQEIAELRRAEEKRVRAVTERAAVVDGMGDGLVLLSLDGRITDVNPAFERITGYSEGEIVGEDADHLLRRMLVPEDVETASLNLRNTLKGETSLPHTMSFTVEAKAGRRVNVTFTVSLMKSEKGRPVAIIALMKDVTERKKAEEALRESEQRYRFLYEESQAINLVIGMDGKIIDLNKSALELIGYEKKNVIGKDTIEFVVSEQREAVAKQLAQDIKGEQTPQIQLDIIAKEGIRTLLFAEGHGTIFEKDRPVGILISAVDITERKRAEEALRESEERFRALFETAQDSIFIKGRTLEYTQVNPAMEQLFGLPASKLLGRTDEELFGKEAGKHITEVDSRVLNGEIIKEEHSKPVKGTPKSFHVVKVPMRNSSGRIIGLCGIARDITERKQAEEKLRESEKKFRNLVEHAHDAICIIQDDRFKFANQEFSDLLNYSWEELKQLDFKEIIAPEHRDMVADRYYRRQKGEKIPEEYEFVLLTKDGERKYVELSVSLVDYLGKVASHCFLRDVTEKKKMEAQLMQAERLTAVGTLAYGIAHEFNNILAGILGNAEFGMGSGDSKEVERCFRVIMENCDRAGSITNSLLTLARQRQVKKEAADLTDAVENVVGLVERELEKQNIRVERKFNPVPEIVCDLGELSEVFLNMITNARDAMKPDGGTLTIELRKRNDNIEIIFADTGCGIPDEIKGRIFEPFVTTKGALGQSEIPGTGLGLFLSYGIISRYQGEIEVQSEEGQGCTFTIKIPVTQNQQLPDRAEAEDERPTVLPPNLNILLVDDEEAICNVVKKFLEEKGCSVVDTTSGKEGLKLFKDGTFDLVLSDITMPDMDGVKLISKLKSIDHKVKLITLTGHVAEEKLEGAKKAGADQILNKPFKKEDLYRAIGRALSV